MDYLEALRTLGLDEGADPESTRRAYLKLVRKHSPEKDPEAFQRIRLAYDTLRERRPWGSAAARMAAPPAWPADERSNDGSSDLPSSSTTEPAVCDVQQALRELDPLAPDERVRRLRALIDEHPTHPDPRWALHDVLSEQGKDKAAAAVLRAARDATVDGDFHALLVMAHAELLTSEDANTTVERGNPHELMHAADGLVASKPARAARLTDAALQAWRKNPGAFELPAWPVLHVLLALQAAAKTNVSRRLLEQATPALSDVKRLRDAAAAMWVVTRELVTLPDSFPLELRTVMARGLLAGDKSFVWGELQQFASDKKLSTEKALHILATRAPGLHGIFQGALRIVPTQVRSSPFSARWAWAPVIIVAFNLLRLCSTSSSSTPSRPSYVHEDRNVAVPTTLRRPDFGPPQPRGLDLATSDVYGRICKVGSPAPACSLADRALLAAATGDCDESVITLGALQATSGGNVLNTPELTEYVRVAVQAACPGSRVSP